MGDTIEYWASVNDEVALLGEKNQVVLVIPNVIINNETLYIDPSNYTVELNGVDAEEVTNAAVEYNPQTGKFKIVASTQERPTNLTASIEQDGTTHTANIDLNIKIRAVSMSWSDVTNNWIIENTYSEGDTAHPIEQSFNYRPTQVNNVYHIPVIIDPQDDTAKLDIKNAVSLVTFSSNSTSQVVSSEPTEYTPPEGSSNIQAALFIVGSNTTSAQIDWTNGWQSGQGFDKLVECTDFNTPIDVSIKPYIGTSTLYLDAFYRSQHVAKQHHTLDVSNIPFVFDTYIYKFNLVSDFTYTGDIGSYFTTNALLSSGESSVTNDHTVGDYTIEVRAQSGQSGTLPLSYDSTTGNFTRVASDLETCDIIYTATGPTDITGNTFTKIHTVAVSCHLYYSQIQFKIDGILTDTATLYNPTQGITDWLGFTIYKEPTTATGSISCQYSYVAITPNEPTPIATVNPDTGAVSVDPGISGNFKLHVIATVYEDEEQLVPTGTTLTADLTITVINQAI